MIESLRFHPKKICLSRLLLHDPFLWVLTVSGLLGFWVGILHPSWQHAAEGAQVLSGVVQYPFQTPHYLYQIKAWTWLHQIPALFLNAGFSEAQISYFISGLMGMLSYQCLAGAFYTFSEDWIFSFFFPLLVDSVQLFNIGLSYPIILNGDVYTYGSIGLSCAFLSLLLISHKRESFGGLLLGMLPAIHLGLGGMAVLCVVPILLVNGRKQAVKLMRWAGLGYGITFLTFLLHWQRYPIAASLERFSKDELIQFIRVWDGHRNHSVIHSPGPILVFLMVPCLFYILRKERAWLSEKGRVMLYFLLSAGIWSLVFTLIWLAPLECIPLRLIQLMPTRISNIFLLALPALILGSLRKMRLPNKGLLFYTVLLILLFFPQSRFFQEPVFVTVFLLGLFCFFLACVSKKAKLLFRLPVFVFQGFKAVLILYFFYKILHHNLIVPGASFSQGFQEVYAAPAGEVVLKEVRKKTGILLPGPDLYWMQLQTRRPILVDLGALDIVSYLPELGPDIRRIVKAIYGFDILPAGPLEFYEGMDFDRIYARWTNRSEEEWKEIRREFNVTQVLTANWPLQLPVAASNEALALHDIPE